MLIRNGVDIIEIDRLERTIQRFGAKFLNRVFTKRELEEAGYNIQSLAARFAAKEAVSKALGTGIGKVSWKDIEIRRGEENQPVIFLSESAKSISTSLGLSHWSLSLSHSSTLAIAFVIAIGVEIE